ncbi:hypothetical protein C0993_009505, partial [Termitomyces sp. T159_Od127]
KPISLVSHSDVRYRGILAGIDPAASTIQLSNGPSLFLLSAATDFAQSTLWAPSLAEVKDLAVDEPAVPPHRSVHDDPAVLVRVFFVSLTEPAHLPRPLHPRKHMRPRTPPQPNKHTPSPHNSRIKPRLRPSSLSLSPNPSHSPSRNSRNPRHSLHAPSSRRPAAATPTLSTLPLRPSRPSSAPLATCACPTRVEGDAAPVHPGTPRPQPSRTSSQSRQPTLISRV